MTIDEFFTNQGIDFDAIVNVQKKVTSITFFTNTELSTRNYSIPSYDSEIEYPGLFILPLDANSKIKNIVSLFPMRGRFAGIATLQEATYLTILPDVEFQRENIVCAKHGNNYVTNQSEEIQYLAVELYSSETLETEIYRGLKSLYYYSFIGDWNQFYTALTALSNAKSNVLGKFNKVRPIRKSSGNVNIGLFSI